MLFREPGQRAAAEAALSDEGVMTKRYFFPVHRMDVYRKFARRALPVTDWLYERLLCIPLYSDLPDGCIDAVAQLIRASSNRASGAEGGKLESCDQGLVPKCGSAAVRLKCFFVDGCENPSSWSSSIALQPHQARPAGANAYQSVGPAPSPPASDPTPV